MSYWINFSSFGILALLALSCATSRPGTGDQQGISGSNCPRVVSKADSLESLQLVVGEEFCVRLESNPGTGYSWVVDSVNSSVLSQAGISRPASRPSGTPGEVDIYDYHFIAESAGETLLLLSYKRIRQENIPAADTFAIRVIVASQ